MVTEPPELGLVDTGGFSAGAFVGLIFAFSLSSVGGEVSPGFPNPSAFSNLKAQGWKQRDPKLWDLHEAPSLSCVA